VTDVHGPPFRQDDGAPILGFRDANGKARITLESLADGTPGLTFRDAEDAMRFSLVVLPGGLPGLNSSTSRASRGSSSTPTPTDRPTSSS